VHCHFIDLGFNFLNFVKDTLDVLDRRHLIPKFLNQAKGFNLLKYRLNTLSALVGLPNQESQPILSIHRQLVHKALPLLCSKECLFLDLCMFYGCLEVSRLR